MYYPNLEEVMNANHEELAHWYLSLPRPNFPEERKIFQHITEQLNNRGGLTEEISAKTGWSIDASYKGLLYISKGRIMRMIKDPRQFCLS